jgi:hypothetical protein
MAHAVAPPSNGYAHAPMTCCENFDSRDTGAAANLRSSSEATNLALMIVSLVLSVIALIVGSIGLIKATNHNMATKHASQDAAFYYAISTQSGDASLLKQTLHAYTTAMYTKRTVVDRDLTPKLEVSQLTDLTSTSVNAYIFGGSAGDANNKVWSYVTKAEVPLLEELRMARDQLPEVARRDKDRFGDTAMFSISNTTNVFEFSQSSPFYQNHATLDCATWSNEETAHIYINCAQVLAGIGSTYPLHSTIVAGSVQKVQFRLMDRYGNYDTKTQQFMVTS